MKFWVWSHKQKLEWKVFQPNITWTSGCFNINFQYKPKNTARWGMIPYNITASTHQKQITTRKSLTGKMNGKRWHHIQRSQWWYQENMVIPTQSMALWLVITFFLSIVCKHDLIKNYKYGYEKFYPRGILLEEVT